MRYVWIILIQSHCTRRQADDNAFLTQAMVSTVLSLYYHDEQVKFKR